MKALLARVVIWPSASQMITANWLELLWQYLISCLTICSGSNYGKFGVSTGRVGVPKRTALGEDITKEPPDSRRRPVDLL